MLNTDHMLLRIELRAILLQNFLVMTAKHNNSPKCYLTRYLSGERELSLEPKISVYPNISRCEDIMIPLY